jgi:hypothetical protein
MSFCNSFNPNITYSTMRSILWLHPLQSQQNLSLLPLLDQPILLLHPLWSQQILMDWLILLSYFYW